MKKKENIANKYANKLIAYEGIISKANAFISKYNRELEEKENEKKGFLKRKKENQAKRFELENKRDKADKRYWPIVVFIILASSSGFMFLASVGIWSHLFYLGSSVLVSIYGIVRDFKIKKIGRELDNITNTMNDEEKLELDLANEIAKIRKKIEKLEQVELVAKVKVEVFREFLDQLEEEMNLEAQQLISSEQVSLQTPQVVAPKQVVASRQTLNTQPKSGKERKVSLW